MGARELLVDLNEAGFQVAAEGNYILVRPLSALPTELRLAIQENRRELLTIAPRRSWRVTLPGRPSFGMCCPQGATADEVMARWPGAHVEPTGGGA